MNFTLRAFTPQPKVAYHILHFLGKSFREEEITHNIGRDILGHCFDQSILSSKGLILLLPSNKKYDFQNLPINIGRLKYFVNILTTFIGSQLWVKD